MSKIRVLVVEPNDIPRLKEIENTLDTYKEIVQGYIECIYPWKDIIIVCNEEGKILNLKPNRFVKGNLIVGTFIIVGNDNKGDFRSLTDEEIKSYKKLFNAKTKI